MSWASLGWRPRIEPLAIEGLAARGAAGHLLARRLLERGSQRELSGVKANDCLIVLGPAEHLPWVDGAVYLGREDPLHLLYLPTHLAPSLPVSWLTQGLRAQLPRGPWALLPDNQGIGLGRSSPLDPSVLEAHAHSSF